MKNKRIEVTVSFTNLKHRFQSIAAANTWLLWVNDRLESHFQFTIRNIDTGKLLDSGIL